MLIFLTVCVAIITLTLVIGLALWFTTLRQVRRSAEAIEVLAYQARSQLERLKETSQKWTELAAVARSKWIKALAAGLGLTATLWAKNKRRGKARPEA